MQCNFEFAHPREQFQFPNTSSVPNTDRSASRGPRPGQQPNGALRSPHLLWEVGSSRWRRWGRSPGPPKRQGWGSGCGRRVQGRRTATVFSFPRRLPSPCHWLVPLPFWFVDSPSATALLLMCVNGWLFGHNPWPGLVLTVGEETQRLL